MPPCSRRRLDGVAVAIPDFEGTKSSLSAAKTRLVGPGGAVLRPGPKQLMNMTTESTSDPHVHEASATGLSSEGWEEDGEEGRRKPGPVSAEGRNGLFETR